MMGYGEFGHTIYTKLGSGRFNNVYGRNGSYITAGQQDYAERLNQIESQREEYYKELGIPPGVPTMKGAYGDPENTGVGYNTIITELGDHSVPKNWEQFVVKRGQGDTPGPPIIWSDPQNPEDAQPGYGFIADDTNEEETFFYHSDHLGSTSYITDDKGNITQYTAYLPYGELLVDEHSSSEELPYKFNGKELDEETGLYYYGARYMQPVASIWYGVDPLMEKYPDVSGYVYCLGTPVNAVDTDGREVYLYVTTLPGNDFGKLNPLQYATHTFLVVTDSKNNVRGYFAYGSEYMGLKGAFGGRLVRQFYDQDISVYKGEDTKSLKNKIKVAPPKGMTSEEFDQRVIDVANSFGNNADITYFMLPTSQTEGNCNTSTSTILLKAGVSSERIKEIKDQIPGISTGFSDQPKPWTKEEQKNAVERRKNIKEMNSKSGFGPVHP